MLQSSSSSFSFQRGRPWNADRQTAVRLFAFERSYWTLGNLILFQFQLFLTYTYFCLFIFNLSSLWKICKFFVLSAKFMMKQTVNMSKFKYLLNVDSSVFFVLLCYIDQWNDGSIDFRLADISLIDEKREEVQCFKMKALFGNLLE
ncbi:hypothetical protein T10_6911 [Trichinella papuae]|uniref:Uncharacterized protein n=1 Tax=Trichinella papuae TaxID=268474 RepID=A0A0V1MWA3_9BILA|nr:hypothetical protein T10_6911 [Trichinella papuae]